MGPALPRELFGAPWYLLREVPEEMKPRRIAVATTDGTPEAEQVEAPKQVAWAKASSGIAAQQIEKGAACIRWSTAR
jgi:hypothetical protein